jgi:hypothetical protein
MVCKNSSHPHTFWFLLLMLGQDPTGGLPAIARKHDAHRQVDHTRERERESIEEARRSGGHGWWYLPIWEDPGPAARAGRIFMRYQKESFGWGEREDTRGVVLTGEREREREREEG